MSAPVIILASASPRRADLLREHGYQFEVRPAEIDELTPRFLTVGEITLLNAKRKAEHVARLHPGKLVLGADTLVSLDGKILGKPADDAEAVRMLTRLNGRRHEVYSGVWLISGEKSRAMIEISHVRMRALSPEEIETYLARIEPLDKAGAYAAQDNKDGVVESVEGSFTNVVGLPMEALERALRDLGVKPGS